MADVLGAGGAAARRSCIRRTDGASLPCIEHPRILIDGKASAPTLHLSIDQGSIGLSAAVWMAAGRGLRMTLCTDVCHRIHNDVLDGLCATGLSVLRLEFTQVNKMRRGPFNGQTNASVMKAVAEEMWCSCDSQNPIFGLLYEAGRGRCCVAHVSGAGQIFRPPPAALQKPTCRDGAH